MAGAVLTNPLDVVRNVSRAKFIDMSCLGSISVYIYIYIYICLACLESLLAGCMPDWSLIYKQYVYICIYDYIWTFIVIVIVVSASIILVIIMTYNYKQVRLPATPFACLNLRRCSRRRRAWLHAWCEWARRPPLPEKWGIWRILTIGNGILTIFNGWFMKCHAPSPGRFDTL